MSADELRKAAERLRDLCAKADADYDAENEERWFRVEGEQIGVWGKFAAAYDNEAPYIATMHPGVGLALADWLERCANRADHTSLARLEHDPEERDWYNPALRIARLILGGAS